jgi:hypothetical protein
MTSFLLPYVPLSVAVMAGLPLKNLPTLNALGLNNTNKQDSHHSGCDKFEAQRKNLIEQGMGDYVEQSEK